MNVRKWKFNTDKNYLTDIEYKRFEKLMEIGELTIFRTNVCATEGCEKLVPKQGVFKYCSKGCMEKHKGVNDETG